MGSLKPLIRANQHRLELEPLTFKVSAGTRTKDVYNSLSVLGHINLITSADVIITTQLLGYISIVMGFPSA